MPAERPIHWPEEDPTDGRGYSYRDENNNSFCTQTSPESNAQGGIRGSIRRLSTLTGKTLLATFFTSQLLDVAMTKTDLEMFHANEINVFGGAEMLSNFGEQNAYLIKLGVSAILIGAYILSSIHEREIRILNSNVRLKHVMEKGLQGGTVLMTGVVLWDSVNLGTDIISNIKF